MPINLHELSPFTKQNVEREREREKEREREREREKEREKEREQYCFSAASI